MYMELMGIRLHIEQYGKAGPQVLLLHGWGCTLMHFRPIIDTLKNQYQLTAIDFPAHGASSAPLTTWSVHDFSGLVAILIQELKLEPVHIIAHSFGARVAICLAAERPELVKRMVLTGAAGIRPTPTKAQVQRSAAYQRGKAAVKLLSKLPGMKNNADMLREKLIKKYGSADYAALSPEMRATFSKIVGEDLSALLPSVRAETLLIFGSVDTETPLWMGERMAKEIQDAALIVFEGRGHFAYLEEWPRFCTIVQEFLK